MNQAAFKAANAESQIQQKIEEAVRAGDKKPARAAKSSAKSIVARPLYRVHGGKRQIQDLCLDAMPKVIERFGDLFFGAGAITYHVKNSGRLAENAPVTANDLNPWMKRFHEALVADPSGLRLRCEIEFADAYLRDPHTTYYGARERWNRAPEARTPELYFFLRTLMWNGVYRENRAGELNTPRDTTRKKLSLPPLSVMELCATALKDVRFLALDFRKITVPKTDRRPTLFLDPPYYATEVKYTKEGFDLGATIHCILWCAAAEAAGAHVVLCNADHPHVRDALERYWPTGVVRAIEEKRNVNSDGAARGPVATLLIHTRHA